MLYLVARVGTNGSFYPICIAANSGAALKRIIQCTIDFHKANPELRFEFKSDKSIFFESDECQTIFRWYTLEYVK